MNLLAEVGHFLIPGLDVLQLFFFIAMVAGVTLTIRGVKRRAKEANWQTLWDGQTQGKMNSGLGSAAELSQSVATKAEKIAAIMPGMLLIVGLLGTFLGLGLALDKASGILHNTGNSIGAMDSAMGDLMNMMQGLGVKFKTSTWGIIAFITLKCWETHNGYEERRLSWCMARLQQAIDESREAEEATRRQQLQQQQQTQITATDTLVAAFAQETQTLRDTFAQQVKQGEEAEAQRHAQQQQAQKTATESLVAALAQQTQTLRDEFVQQAKRAEEYEAQRHTHQLATLTEIADINGQSRSLLESYTRSSQQNLEALQQAAGAMSHASQKVADSAESLQGVVSTLGEDLSSVMNDIRSELSAVVTEMNSDFTRNVQQMSEMLSASTRQLSATMETIERSLKAAIGEMGDAFSSNMTEMASQLTSATTVISQSVDNMSARIDSTMTELSEKTNEAAKVQSRVMNDFSITSENLNIEVQEMTQYIKRVTKEIQTSLIAVSVSNQRLESLPKRFSDSQAALEDACKVIVTLHEKLEDLCAVTAKQLASQLPSAEKEALIAAVMDMQRKLATLLTEAQHYRLNPLPESAEA